MLFQEAVKKYSDTDSGSEVSVEDFASLYPIIHVDVSKQRERLKMGTDNLKVRWQLVSNFRNLAASDDSVYHVYCLVLSDRYIMLGGGG